MISLAPETKTTWERQWRVALWLALLIVACSMAGAQSVDAIVSAANLQPCVAPDSWALITGSNLSQKTKTADGPTTSLEGIQVAVNGVPAQILYVSPRIIGFIVPPETGLGSQSVVLTSDTVSINSSAVVVKLAPGVFETRTLRRDRGLTRNPLTKGQEPFNLMSPGAAPDGRTRVRLVGTGWRAADSITVEATILDGLRKYPLVLEQTGPSSSAGLDIAEVVLPDFGKNAGLIALTMIARDAEGLIVFSNATTIQTDEPAYDTAVNPAYFVRRIAGLGEPGYSGDQEPALLARVNQPNAIAVDQAHNLYIADTGNHIVRVIRPGGIISTFAGNGNIGSNGDEGQAASAELETPTGLAVDRLGNLYIADASAHRIRMVDPHGIIHTVAGNGTAGYFGDGGLAVSSLLRSPSAVATDRFGNVLIADTGNHRVRMITAGDSKIHTLAGTGAPGMSGDNDGAVLAQLNLPSAVAADAEGTVYIADAIGKRIRAVDPDGKIRWIAGKHDADVEVDDGVMSANRVSTLAGRLDTGSADQDAADSTTDSSTRGRAPKRARFDAPVGIAVDRLARLWISDPATHRVRMVGLDGYIHAMAGDGVQGDNGDDGMALNAQFHSPAGLSADPAGNVFIADRDAHRVRMLTENSDCSQPPVLTFVPQVVVGGQKVTAYLRLACPVQAEKQFALETNFAGITAPSSVTVRLGESVAAFTLQTPRLGSSPEDDMRFVDVTLRSVTEAVKNTLTINRGIWNEDDFSPTVAVKVLHRYPPAIGGRPILMRLLLGGAAPEGGKQVTVQANYITPTTTTLTVAAGEIVADFLLTAPNVQQPTVVDICVVDPLNAPCDAVQVNPQPESRDILAVTVTPGQVPGGSSATGTVTLADSAPAGGIAVALSSSDSAVQVPGTIVIPEGESAGTFPIATSIVGAPLSTWITAASANSASAPLELMSDSSNGGTVSILSVTLNPATVPGGTPSTGTVVLAAPAPAGGVTITLSSNNGIATVPATITIPEGQSSGTFQVMTSPSASTQIVEIVATSANTAGAVLTITATQAGPAQLAGLSLNPTSLPGGQASTGTVTLVTAAPVQGALVTLSSDYAGATVPASIIIPGGQISAAFVVNTSIAGSAHVANITAASANTVSAPLTITVSQPATGQIIGLTFNPQTVTGGSPSTGTVTLAAPAPVNGILVNLASNSGAASVPASIVIAQGQTSGTFPVTTTAVASTQVAGISATSANTVTGNLTINPGSPGTGTILAITLNPSSVPGGSSSTGTVTLSAPAGPNGVTVTLSSGDPKASVPGSIVIPAGQGSGTFTVTTQPVGAQIVIPITATSANTMSANLTLTATPAGEGQIASLSVNPTSVPGGSPSTGTVTLAAPAPANGILVNLTCNNAVATVPASITIGGGQTSGTFQVNTTVVGSTQIASISATSANTVAADLTITATPAGQGQIIGLSLNPGSVAGGSISTGTVTLANPAPSNGVLVNLSSNNGAATVPATITIPSGSMSGTFTVNTVYVATQQNATITASSANTTTANLTITVAPPSSGQLAGLSLNPTTVAGGSPSTGTVTLVSPAPANGVLVNLASNDAVATVPPSIVIPGGQSAATFTVTTLSTASQKNVGITATSTNTANATLTVTASSVCVQGLNLTASITNLLTGQGLLTGTVTLTGPAPQGGSTVSLLSGSTQLGTVFIPQGQSSGAVNLAVTGIQTLLGSTIQAVLNGCPLINATLMLASGQSAPAFLSSLSLNPSSLTGGTSSVLGTVTLSAPAPSSGAVVALQSSNPAAVTVPASITIPAGQTTGTFQMTATPVSQDTPVTITATSINSLSATFNDKSPCVSGLNLTVKVTNLLTGQGLLSGTVGLTGPAPAGGSTVNLVGLNSNLLVPQGATSAPVSLSVANAPTLIGSVVTGVLGSCPGFPVTVQLGL